MIVDYLKNQASRCMSLARACFDLETARQLRLMAEEFKAKADEIAAQAKSRSQQPQQQQQQNQDDGR